MTIVKILGGLIAIAVLSAAFNGGMSLAIGATLGETAQWIFVPVAFVIGCVAGWRYMRWAFERWT